MTQTFSVAGMNCQSCVKHVTHELGALPGVESVRVDLGTPSVVHVDADRTLSQAEITEALAEAGDYTLVP